MNDGQELFDSVMEAYDLSPVELAILKEAVHTVDELAVMRDALAQSDAIVLGYKGQPRPNPMYRLIAEHRDLLHRILLSLEVPDAQ